MLGVVLIVQAVALQASNALDDDPSTKFDYKAVTTAVIAGWALMHTRDNKVSSEQAGAGR